VISFRYHIVSIVAVFLALALGIVVGTTALNGPITKDLRRQVNDAKKQRDSLAGQVKVLQGQVDDAGQFASTYGEQLVAGSLTGKNVVEIVLPGATSDMQDGIGREINAAGAKISGRLTITKTYLDASQSTGINTLATGSVRPITLNFPETNDAGQLGGAMLAYVLLGKGAPTDLTQVLGGFSELHMTSYDADITPSTTVIVLGHGTLPSKDYGGGMELSLVAALAHYGGHVVVAGDTGSATDGGLVALVRDSQTDKAAVATVDDAESAYGQVSAVLALAAVTKGQVGHYGTEKGANALFPLPAK
jgi:hypothetical protein